MKITISPVWLMIVTFVAYKARGWDGVLYALVLFALYFFIIFPLMTSFVARRHK